jgi:Fe-Mn family superoxide dismutase
MQPAKLPDLGYHFNALEPFISAEIMEIHYTKHHQAYVNNLNTSLEKAHDAEQRGDLTTLINLQQAIRFNGGGHINHSIFWTNLKAPKEGGGHLHKGPLLEQIEKDFLSFDNFKDKMTQMALAHQGSGWVWLGYDKGHKRLSLASCTNQDPLSLVGLVPLFGIDVWEHAYYLQYKNVRADYIKNIWNIVNYNNVEERFIQASI